MLDMFRKRGVASIVYSGLMAAMAVIFIIQFRPGANTQGASLTQKCVAKVRGDCIDEKDWKAQRFLLRGLGEQAPALNYNKMAIDSLVERTLLEHEAKRLGIRVSEEDVMQELVRYKVYVHVPGVARGQARMMGINDAGFRGIAFGTKEKPFDQQIYEKTIHAMTGQTASEFEDNQLHELLAARVLNLVAERVRVSDDEAWEQYVQDKTTVTTRYVRFDPKYFGDMFAPKDPATIEKWAADHKKDVDAREATLPKDKPKRLVKARHILIEAKKDAPADKRAEAHKKAQQILAELAAGEDFAKLARENSADPGSKDKGGEYDWTDASEYVPEYQKAVTELKPGQTAVVETQFGYHVIQVIGHYDGVAAVAYPLYVQAKGEELAKQAADKVEAALAGKLPVKADDPKFAAKLEELKKSGRQEAEAKQQVVDDETKRLVDDAIDTTLRSMAPASAQAKPGEAKQAAEAPKPAETKPVEAPKPAETKPGEPAKPAETKPAEKKPEPVLTDGPIVTALPTWENDPRKPSLEESSPVNASGSPVNGLEDQGPVVQAAFKLTKEAPLSPPVKASGEYFLVMLRDRHEATKDEFAKDKQYYLGSMLAKKREDATVNFLADLRETLGKDAIWVDARYTADEHKKEQGGEGQQAPYEDEPGQ